METLVGHAPGGVCPFGINEGVEVYLDESLRKFETVYPAWRGGTAGEAQQLAGAYRAALELAVEYHCESVAVPPSLTAIIISTRIFRC